MLNYPNESLVLIMGSFLARSTLGLCPVQITKKYFPKEKFPKKQIEFITEFKNQQINNGQSLIQCLQKVSPKTVVNFQAESPISEDQFTKFQKNMIYQTKKCRA